MQISLAITAYNSSKILRANVEPIKDDPRIAEIVICDDHSSDYEALTESLRDIKHVRLIRNPKNIGCAHNKLKAVACCKTEWAMLLDADNRIDKIFLDTLEKTFDARNPCVIFTPAFFRPCFNYSHMAGHIIDKSYVATRTRMEDRLLPFLNDGNYLVNVREYVACACNMIDLNCVPGSEMMFSYFWLQSGNTFLVVPNLEYDHAMHPDSLWMRNQERGTYVVRTLRAVMSGDWNLDANKF